MKIEGEPSITDSEKLDLILEKLDSVESEMKALRRQHMKDTAELKAMDSLILDEVEVNPMPLHESKKSNLSRLGRPWAKMSGQN